MRISREQIEQLRAALMKAPEVPPGGADATKQEAVRLLVGEIQALQQRGYSLEQIAELFRDGGLVLTTPTLKSYLSRAKGGRKRRRAGQRAKAGGGAEAPAPAVVASRVVGPETADGEKKDAAKARPTDTGGAGGKAEGGPPEASDGSKLRSGKDAFLIKDKDSY